MFEQSALRQIGPYRILDVLGEGGMGTVYLAEQTAPVQRRVALKLIKLGMDSKAVVARFEQERQALALMQHDGIAKVYDAGISERGQPYFVMEHVKGIPLAEFCDRNRLDLPQRLQLMRQVCAAVQHAHQKAVVHRDLKPANVLVADEGGKVQPKIIDFGLAKALGQKLIQQSLFTEVGQIIGTPEYMAPEQAEPTNADIDTRADVYSLGVILYELLVGQLPFTREELRQAGLLGMQRLLRETEPPRPSTRLSSLGATASSTTAARRTSLGALQRALKNDLDWVAVKCLEKDRNRRYDTAAGLAADLQRFLEHEPLTAGPPSAVYRLKKLFQRYRLQASLAAAIVILMTVCTVVSLHLYRNARHQAMRVRDFASLLIEQMGDMGRVVSLGKLQQTINTAADVDVISRAKADFETESKAFFARRDLLLARVDSLRSKSQRNGSVAETNTADLQFTDTLDKRVYDATVTLLKDMQQLGKQLRLKNPQHGNDTWVWDGKNWRS